MLRMGVVSTAVYAEATDNPLSMTELVPFVNENWLLWENSGHAHWALGDGGRFGFVSGEGR